MDASTGPPVRRSVKVASLLFVASRAWIALALWVAARHIPMRITPPWTLDSMFLDPLIRWDASWYLSIATNGYYAMAGGGQSNLGFFPFYPLLIALLSQLTSMSIPGAAVVLSNLFLWGSLVAMHRLISRDHAQTTADRVIFLVAFHPCTVFFSSAYSESTFLFLSVLAFTALRENRPLLFVVSAVCLSATRLAGLCMVAAGLGHAWDEARRGNSWRRWVGATMLAPLGFACVSAWTWWRVGDPLAYAHAQMAGWGRKPGLPLKLLLTGWLDWWRQLVSGEKEAFTMNYWLMWLYGAWTVDLYRRPAPLRLPYVGYGAASMALVVLGNTRSLESYGRYFMVLFPAYIAGAAWWSERPWVGRLLVACWLLLSAVNAAYFSRWYWIA